MMNKAARDMLAREFPRTATITHGFPDEPTVTATTQKGAGAGLRAAFGAPSWEQDGLSGWDDARIIVDATNDGVRTVIEYETPGDYQLGRDALLGLNQPETVEARLDRLERMLADALTPLGDLR